MRHVRRWSGLSDETLPTLDASNESTEGLEDVPYGCMMDESIRQIDQLLYYRCMLKLVEKILLSDEDKYECAGCTILLA